MNIVVVTPPPVEPVTLEEIYDHLRLDPEGSPPEHPDDAMLSSMITAARERVEQATRRALVMQSLRLITTGFPRSRVRMGAYGDDDDFIERGDGWIELPRPPLIEVTGVSYFDDANALQVIDPTQYFVTEDFVPRLCLVSGAVWPTAYTRSDAVRIDYIAGYAPTGSPFDDFTSNIPEGIKAAIKLEVQLQYDEIAPEKRQGFIDAIDRHLASYRVHRF